MKRFGAILVLLVLAAVPAWPQSGVRIYTNPVSPKSEVLERLQLKQAWRIKVPTQGRRDGIASVQLAPWKGNPQLLVQTLSGEVAVLDAETGDTIWRAAVGRPYQVLKPAAVNTTAVITVRGERIFVLDRDTGKQLLNDVDNDSGLPIWGMALDGVPSAGLVADEDAVFVPLGSRVAGFLLPNFRAALKAKDRDKDSSGKRIAPSPQLKRLYNKIVDPIHIGLGPLLAYEYLCLAGSDGTFLLFNKFSGKEIFTYKLQSPISAEMAQHDNAIYVASEDYHVYAFDVVRGKLLWRFHGSAPILHKVEVNDQDVYATPERQGLHRVDRKSGRAVWKNRAAQRMVACNAKFVYATDIVGNLLVLDHERGTQLAAHDMRDWVVPISNELTDRLYFAAHDGSIICLHHLDHASPLRLKTSPESVLDGKPKPKPKDDKKPVDPKKKKEEMSTLGCGLQYALHHPSVGRLLTWGPISVARSTNGQSAKDRW